MMESRKTKINDISVKYWFNFEKEARLTLNWEKNQITFLGEDAVISLIEWLKKRRFHSTA